MTAVPDPNGPAAAPPPPPSAFRWTLRLLFSLAVLVLLVFCGGGGGSTPTPGGGGTGVGGTPGVFAGSVLLGSPTASSIKANVLSATQSGTVYLACGTVPGAYPLQSAPMALVAGTPVELALTGLAANTQYYYRLFYLPAGGSYGPTAEHAFHTARPAGSTFTFTIQADSHMDENSSLDIYLRSLGNVAAGAPDFHIDLGDTFMCEKHTGPLSAVVQSAPDYATVVARYAYERGNFGTLSATAPVFLVNGNHEGESGWFLNGTASNLAIWTTQARQRYFVNPVPDAFYTGDSVDEPFVGKRGTWYAWTWGDALFVALDPFWNTPKHPGQDAWNLTLGDRQYAWLQQTLTASTAKYKFVFIHNLVGGLDGQMRGGIEAAPFYEWGGKNADGTAGFATKRPTWTEPIHALLVRSGVTAVFHGHDHLYAKQDLDGIVYQEVPQPSAVNNQSGATLAAAYHYAAGTILSSSGHLRVTVAPDKVTAQYIRTWLPAAETTTVKNGSVDHTWTVAAPLRSRTP